MTDDPAHDRITAILAAITTLVTAPPNLIGFDIVFFRDAFIDGGRAVFGEGEAEGPDRAIRAADAAMDDMAAVAKDGSLILRHLMLLFDFPARGSGRAPGGTPKSRKIFQAIPRAKKPPLRRRQAGPQPSLIFP